LANKNGGSKDVEAVMAKERFLVTAAMAVIGYEGVSRCFSVSFRKLTIVGSVIGH
jgi:hypothetical protein